MLRQHVTCFVRDVIPSALGGSDVLATAETGTWVESNAEVNSSLWNGHQASSFHLKILKEKLHVGKLVLNVLLSVLSCISGWTGSGKTASFLLPMLERLCLDAQTTQTAWQQRFKLCRPPIWVLSYLMYYLNITWYILLENIRRV